MKTLVLLALLAARTLAPDDDVTLTIVIDKGGDVRWKDDPCSADLFDGTGRFVRHVDRADTVVVPPGQVDVVVACAAQEGTVKKTARVQAKKDQTVRLALNPGFVLATIERGGKGYAGDVVVYDGFDREVARGRARTVIPVDAGRVRVQGLLGKDTAGTTRDLRGEQTVVVKATAKSELKLDASDGEIVVSVTENGRPARAIIGLREPGSQSRSFELVADTPTAVPSGTWDIVTQIEDTHDFREQLTRGVVVTPGKRTTRSVGHATGRVTPVVTPADGVVVDLLLPGADAAFNQVDPGADVRLSPGRYMLRATRKDELDDGGKPTATANVTVTAGGTQKVALAPAVAHLDVEVRVGGEPRPVPVAIALPGAPSPLVERPASAAGAVGFDVAPQKLVVEARLATAHGPVAVRKETVVRAGNNRLRLDLELGRVVVQVMSDGAAVGAEVRFFDVVKGGKPTGEPRVVVKAGEEAWLPPGIYLLAVKRKGEERIFGDVRVANGRLVERALDWRPAATP
jgi:hypothetical protein